MKYYAVSAITITEDNHIDVQLNLDVFYFIVYIKVTNQFCILCGDTGYDVVKIRSYGMKSHAQAVSVLINEYLIVEHLKIGGCEGQRFWQLPKSIKINVRKLLKQKTKDMQ